MKKTPIIAFLLTFFAFVTLAQGPGGENSVTSRAHLTEATIFPTGAELIHTASANLTQGVNTLEITGLSPVVDRSSVRIPAPDGIVISSYEFKVEILPAERIDERGLEAINGSMEVMRRQVEVLVKDSNIELLGLIFNAANGYDPQEDDIPPRGCPEFCRYYDLFVEVAGGSRAVSLMTEIIDGKLLWENEIFEIGLHFTPGFTGRTPYRSTAFMDDPLHPAYAVVARLVAALWVMYASPLLQEHIGGQYLDDYDRVLLRSTEKIVRMDSLGGFMAGTLGVPSPGTVGVIPVLFLEPYTGYSVTLQNSDGSHANFTLFGTAYSPQDNTTSFNIAANMFVHEYGHYFVRRALEAIPGWERELERLFTPAVAAVAESTGYYTDPDSYFNETFTRALECYIMASAGYGQYAQWSIGEDAELFPYLRPTVEILCERYAASGQDFYTFFPTIISGLTPVTRK